MRETWAKMDEDAPISGIDETRRLSLFFVSFDPRRSLFPVFINLVQERLRSRLMAIAIFVGSVHVFVFISGFRRFFLLGFQ
jgi:uncharacterized protein (DUF58 family)